jgi:hypothetical protein
MEAAAKVADLVEVDLVEKTMAGLHWTRLELGTSVEREDILQLRPEAEGELAAPEWLEMAEVELVVMVVLVCLWL